MPVWGWLLIVLAAIGLTAAFILLAVWLYIVWSSIKDWGQ